MHMAPTPPKKKCKGTVFLRRDKNDKFLLFVWLWVMLLTISKNPFSSELNLSAIPTEDWFCPKCESQLFTFLTLPLVSLNNGKIKTPTQRSKQQCKDPKVNLQLFSFLTLPHFACGQSPPRPPSPSRAFPLQQFLVGHINAKIKTLPNAWQTKTLST